MRPMPVRASALTAVLTAAAVASAASPAATERRDEIVMLGNLAGEQKFSTGSDGVTHAEYSSTTADAAITSPPPGKSMAPASSPSSRPTATTI